MAEVYTLALCLMHHSQRSLRRHTSTCAGLYVEGMETGEEDVAALERRWLKPIYTAAPKLVLRYALQASSNETMLRQV